MQEIKELSTFFIFNNTNRFIIITKAIVIVKAKLSLRRGTESWNYITYPSNSQV